MELKRIEKIEIEEPEIQILYDQCKALHEKHLKTSGIKFPELKNGNGFISKALQIVALYKYQGSLIHKDTIAQWIKKYIPEIGNDVQVRHLSSQNGFNTLNSLEKIPGSNQKVPSGCHVLLDLKNVSPNYQPNKRIKTLTDSEWEIIKDHNDNKCVSCGAKEGEAHPKFPNKITQLQKGHKDPTKPVDKKNVIPQCQVCNQQSKDIFVFDKSNEKIVSIGRGGTRLVYSAEEDVKKEVFENLEASGYGNGVADALAQGTTKHFKILMVEKILESLSQEKNELLKIKETLDSLLLNHSKDKKDSSVG